jgi:dolichyl-phosphate beta-glucosyltransferase
MYLSIIIPAYNEEKRLPQTLSKVIDFISQQTYSVEILIINDGSTDNTASLVEDLAKNESQIKLIDNRENRGKAFSVNQGIKLASGEYILFMDADGSTPIDEVQKLIEALDCGFDIAIGSRRVFGANVVHDQSIPRLFLGWIFRHIVSIILPLNIIDTQNGFKLFKNQTAKIIFAMQKSFGWAFDVEILYLAHKLGYKIKEVPIVWNNNDESKVKLLGKVKMLFEIIKIRFNKYDKRVGK